MQAMQDGMGERMGTAAGGSVQVEFGEMGKPKVYSQAGDVVRYGMQIPIDAVVNGRAVKMRLECAGAVLVLNGKLLMFNAYRPSDETNPSFAQVRTFLDAAVARAQALNATTTTAGGAGGRP
jgi:hypothetical protein